MPIDFGLSKLEVEDKLVELPLPQIEGGAKLFIKPATEINKPYLNAVLRSARTSAGRKKVNAAYLAEAREEDKKLFALHVIKGWENITDTNKVPVPFSPENVLDFLHQIPTWLFDDIRRFAGDPLNFLEDADPEDLSKNSASGFSGN